MRDHACRPLGAIGVQLNPYARGISVIRAGPGEGGMAGASVLKGGTDDEKAAELQRLESEGGEGPVQSVIAMLDDGSVRVRGEAFASLVANKHDIAGMIAGSLGSPSRNVRGFAILVLANRGETGMVPRIAELAGDGSAMVRSCVMGALGHLGAVGEKDVLFAGVADPDAEVQKSALHSLAQLGVGMTAGEAAAIRPADYEAEMLAGRITRLG